MHIIALSPFITLIHNRGQSYLSLISRNNCIPFAALSKKAWWPLCVAVRSYTCRYANEFVCLICQTHTQSLTWVCPKLQASKVRSLNSINPLEKRGWGGVMIALIHFYMACISKNWAYKRKGVWDTCLIAMCTSRYL